MMTEPGAREQGGFTPDELRGTVFLAGERGRFVCFI